MVTLEIQLPEEMLIFVEAQAQARGHANPSQYLQSLIEEARQIVDRSEFENRFHDAVQALARGEPCSLSADDWKRLRDRRM